MNAYKIQALKDMGIDVAKLGCVMLDVEQLTAKALLDQEWAYYAKEPERFPWVKGYEVDSHVTLLYGLLQNANDIRSAVDEVLTGWDPFKAPVNPDYISAFQSTIDSEPYSCIVMHIFPDQSLIDAHARLSLLPHIDTFWEYKPHVTIGYVHADKEEAAIDRLVHSEWNTLKVKGLNYGREVK